MEELEVLRDTNLEADSILFLASSSLREIRTGFPETTEECCLLDGPLAHSQTHSRLASFVIQPRTTYLGDAHSGLCPPASSNYPDHPK